MNFPTTPPKYELSKEALEGMRALYKDNPKACPEFVVSHLLETMSVDGPLNKNGQLIPEDADKSTQS